MEVAAIRTIATFILLVVTPVLLAPLRAEGASELTIGVSWSNFQEERWKTDERALRDELTMRMKKCNENLLQLFNEMCGLITIRNELYKMSGVHVYMQDCEVGDWVGGDCTVSCGGGTQDFTRGIVQEKWFGAACPPLSKTEMCNQDPCPIETDDAATDDGATTARAWPGLVGGAWFAPNEVACAERGAWPIV